MGKTHQKHKVGLGAVTSSKSPKSMQITKIVVDLSHRKLSAYAGTVLVYEFHCVIGREGHETVPGKFHIFKKEEMHLSRAYNNAPMPFSMFFSHDGKAIHATPAAGIRSFAGSLGLGAVIPDVGSHGCVGLDQEDAKVLYEKTPVNTLVEVVSGD
jgi:lipoprotein-anchoring transpeptidase ErfK/SrfK